MNKAEWRYAYILTELGNLQRAVKHLEADVASLEVQTEYYAERLKLTDNQKFELNSKCGQAILAAHEAFEADRITDVEDIHEQLGLCPKD